MNENFKRILEFRLRKLRNYKAKGQEYSLEKSRRGMRSILRSELDVELAPLKELLDELDIRQEQDRAAKGWDKR